MKTSSRQAIGLLHAVEVGVRARCLQVLARILPVGFERRKTNMGATVFAPDPGWGLREPSGASTDTNMVRPAVSSGADNELYLKEEIRSEAQFEGIVGQGSALRCVRD